MIDFGFTQTTAPVGPADQIHGRFEGFQIYRCDDGFYWQEGGYSETADECREDIAHWNNRSAPTHDDTPALDAPWWESR